MSVATGKFGAFLRALPGALARNWHVSVPVLLCLVLCAPFLWFLLPSYEPLFADEYQPMKALKFYYTHGQEFHKWGPLTDFLLGPFYGATLVFWRLTGQFENPSMHFPYGFKNPLWQLTTLILEGRVFFLLINIACTAILGRFLGLITSSKSVIFLTLMTMICANPVVVTLFPDTKPDGPSLSFSALALCLYMAVWKHGLTEMRAVWMSFFAACAVSGKELCAMLFVLPYAAMIVRHLWEARAAGVPMGRALRAPCVGVTTGSVVYALMNIVYAPRTWWQRIEFWTTGPGKSSAVWGSGLDSGQMTLPDYTVAVLDTLLDNIGPLGALLAIVGALALLLRRPKGWLFLSLPFVSVTVLGLLPMGYVEDRFYILDALALTPLLALGLDTALRGREPRFAPLLNVAGALASVWFGLIAWYFNDAHYIRAAEKYLAGQGDTTLVVNDGSTFQGIPGKSRFLHLGYKTDVRSLGQIMTEPENRPDIIFISRGRLEFIEDAMRFPARAKMMEEDSGFNVEIWKGGFGAMGYDEPILIEPRVPRWLPFSWVPAVREWNKREALLVYRKKAG